MSSYTNAETTAKIASHPGTAANIESLTLLIDRTNVDVRLSEDGLFRYEYDRSTHNITSTTVGSHMEIKAEKRIPAQPETAAASPFTDMVIVYLPDNLYSNVTVSGMSSGVSLPPFNTNLQVTGTDCALSIQLPKHFDKTVQLSAVNSSGSLTIDAAAGNYEMTVLSDRSAVAVAPSLPVFIMGRPWVHVVGEGTAKINIDLQGSAFTVNVIENQ